MNLFDIFKSSKLIGMGGGGGGSSGIIHPGAVADQCYFGTYTVVNE